MKRRGSQNGNFFLVKAGILAAVDFHLTTESTKRSKMAINAVRLDTTFAIPCAMLSFTQLKGVVIWPFTFLQMQRHGHFHFFANGFTNV